MDATNTHDELDALYLSCNGYPLARTSLQSLVYKTRKLFLITSERKPNNQKHRSFTIKPSSGFGMWSPLPGGAISKDVVLIPEKLSFLGWQPKQINLKNKVCDQAPGGKHPLVFFISVASFPISVHFPARDLCT